MSLWEALEEKSASRVRGRESLERRLRSALRLTRDCASLGSPPQAGTSFSFLRNSCYSDNASEIRRRHSNSKFACTCLHSYW